MTMDLNTNKKKYKLSDTSTPSPSEENKEFSHGFYRQNINYSVESPDGKRPHGVDNDGFDYDEVFTLTRSPPKHIEKSSPRQWREESARSTEETKKTSWDKRGLIVLGFVTVLAFLIAIAVILYFKVFKEEPSSSIETTTLSPVILFGSLSLYSVWNTDLSNSSSQLYKDTAHNFSSEMDVLLQNTSSFQFYLSTNVQYFSAGSVVVHFDISFRPSYSSLYTTIEELGKSVESDIKSKVNSGESNLPINSSSVEIIPQAKSTTTPLPSTSRASDVSTSELPTSLLPSTSKLTTAVKTTSQSTTTEQSTTTTNKQSTTTQQDTTVKETTEVLSTSTTVLQSTPSISTTQKTEPSTTKTTLTSATSSVARETTTSNPTTQETTTSVVTTQETTSSSTIMTTTTPSDGCYILNITECRNVGQTKTIFPNIFSQTTETAANSYFAQFKSTACSTKAMVYLCSILFPPCDNGAPQYPCRNFCEDVQLECPGVVLASQTYCTKLPETNCVAAPVATTPGPSSSTTSLSSSSSKSTPASSSTSPTVSSTSTAGLCQESKTPACRELGHVDIIFPNLFRQRLESEAQVYFNQYHNLTCSANSTYFLCGIFFPLCMDGAPVYPCRSFCEAVASECSGFPLANAQYCSQLPTTNCMDPPPPKLKTSPQVISTTLYTTTPPTTTFVADTYCFLMSPCKNGGTCHDVDGGGSYRCDCTPGYTGKVCDSQVLTTTPYMTPITADTYCFLMSPCKNGGTCHDVDGGGSYRCDCTPGYTGKNCDSQVTTIPSPTTTTTASPLCIQSTVQECQNLNVTEITFPNVFNIPNEAAAIPYFNSYKGQSCSDNATYFLCSMLFPKCERGAILYPCKSFCSDVKLKCPGLGILNLVPCDKLPESNCVSALPTPVIDHPPKANAGPDVYLTPPQSVATLDGIKSSDDNGIVSYHWTKSPFHAQSVTMTQTDTASLQLSNLVLGHYKFILTVSDAKNQTSTDSVHVYVKPACSASSQIRCPDNKCIMQEWLCDGEEECSDGWDESNCSACGSDQFRCLDKTCISMSERCNMNAACPDQSDERICLRINQYSDVLELAYQDFSWYLPLCYTSWTESMGQVVCDKLGLGDYISSNKVIYSVRDYAHVDSVNGNINSYVGKLLRRNDCMDNAVVSVKCKPRGCGQRAVGPSAVQYIIQGQDAEPGNWPWQVSVQLKIGNHYTHVCGGSLISGDFVLSAHHCVLKYLVDKIRIRVLLGATNRDLPEASQKVVGIKRAIKYDESYREYGPGDILLLELDETVIYTPYIQPLCLPDTNDVFYKTSECAVTGWGWTSSTAGNHTAILQELKMKLWKFSDCNGPLAWNGTVTSGYICAGYKSALRSVCTGDSGGPLTCKDNSGIWKLVGISSFVAPNCSKAGFPNVFTDVKNYIEWIKNETKCKFMCDNKKCLYESSLICNRQDDCGDNSDEIRLCTISVNCSFDDAYLCGYNVSHITRMSGPSSSHLISTIPWSDHTLGHYPGHFMVGKSVSSDSGNLTSPVFNASSQVCVRFYYNIRGNLIKRLWVWSHEYSSSGFIFSTKSVWNSEIGELEEGWTMGYFDLGAGVYKISFIIEDVMKIAIDDISVHKGTCQQSVCRADENQCTADTTQRDVVCLPQTSICNVVKECNKDEVNCNVNNTKYLCDFENVVNCGISQVTNDNGEWLLFNQTSLRKVFFADAFTDHTKNSSSGLMLLLLTSLFVSVGDNVKMTQNLFLNDMEHCLQFYYRTLTEMTFKVYIDSKGIKYDLWMFTNRNVSQWTKAQMELPALGYSVLTYEVVRETSKVLNLYKPYIALDDITILPGKCPEYICLDGWTKCANESFCYSNQQRCDRTLQCRDESDEAQCDCKTEEFSCSNGKCIDKKKMCDATFDCLDQSDEGAVCDPLKTVSCDFESPFICGYSVNKSLSETDFRWIRQSGSTPTYFTGPANDHTKGNGDGHYLYAEGSLGNMGDFAFLTSPTFTTSSTTNQSLTFYFHVNYNIPQVVTDGLAVVASYNTSESQEIWWRNGSTGNTWTSACVNLVQSKTLKIIFVAKRKGNDRQTYDADVAVDDIVLKNTACGDSTLTTSSTTSTPRPTTASPSGCKTGEFQCFNGFCILSSSRCDGLPDCLDNSDEVGC